jgi:hypothetical protein
MTRWMTSILVVATAAGCGTSTARGPGPAKAPAGAPPSAAADAGAPAATDDVTLLDPCAEPRARLRYRLPADGRWPFEAVLQISAKTGALPAGKVPDLVMAGEVRVIGAGAGGTRLELVSDHISFRDTPGATVPAQAMNAQLAGWSLTTRATMSPRGRLSRVEVHTAGGPPGVDLTTLTSNLQELVAVLPAAPVGAGARWRRVIHVVNNHVTVDQTADARLVEIHGATARLAVAIDQSAPTQTLPAPAGGPATELHDLAGTGTTAIDLDLTRPISPLRFELHVDLHLAIGGRPSAIHLDTAIDLHLR